MMRTLSLILTLGILPLASLASTFIGNPDASVVLDTGPDVYVHSVIAYSCTSGSQTIPIDTTLSASESEPITFDADEYCDVVVRVKWTSAGPITPVSVTGYDSLDIDESGSSFEIVLDSSAHTAVFH